MAVRRRARGGVHAAAASITDLSPDAIRAGRDGFSSRAVHGVARAGSVDRFGERCNHALDVAFGALVLPPPANLSGGVERVLRHAIHFAAGPEEFRLAVDWPDRRRLRAGLL